MRVDNAFLGNISIEATGCWRWTVSVASNGYGHCSKTKYGTQYAHRAAYLGFVGPIPPRFDIDHLCRNRSCCNPDHLEAVSRSENLRRGLTGRVGDLVWMKTARRTHCKNGHEFTPENTSLRTIQRGDRAAYQFRRCLACHREIMRRYDAAKRGKK